MKLLTKEIKTKAEKQYEFASDLDKQDVVAKFFNPVGPGTWYLMNKSPEVGSFMIEELEDLELPMGMKIERDTSFKPVNAEKLFEELVKNKVH